MAASAKDILDFIGQHEAAGNYNAYYGHAHNSTIDFTGMTVGEVRQWQKDQVAAGAKSAAVGKYQFVSKTLKGLIKSGVVSLDDKFDEATQDKLGKALLRRRGYDRFASGKISADAFGNNLAREWASLPVLTGNSAGKSFYDGDGLNHAGTTPGAVLSALNGHPTPEGYIPETGVGTEVDVTNPLPAPTPLGQEPGRHKAGDLLDIVTRRAANVASGKPVDEGVYPSFDGRLPADAGNGVDRLIPGQATPVPPYTARGLMEPGHVPAPLGDPINQQTQAALVPKPGHKAGDDLLDIVTKRAANVQAGKPAHTDVAYEPTPMPRPTKAEKAAAKAVPAADPKKAAIAAPDLVKLPSGKTVAVGSYTDDKGVTWEVKKGPDGKGKVSKVDTGLVGMLAREGDADTIVGGLIRSKMKEATDAAGAAAAPAAQALVDQAGDVGNQASQAIQAATSAPMQKIADATSGIGDFFNNLGQIGVTTAAPHQAPTITPAVSQAETMNEQRQMRSPTVAPMPGAVAPAQPQSFDNGVLTGYRAIQEMGPGNPVTAPSATAHQPAPATAYKTIENPDYTAWAKQYAGGKALNSSGSPDDRDVPAPNSSGSPDDRDTRHDTRDAASGRGNVRPVAPAAPPKTIRVKVATVAPMPSQQQQVGQAIAEAVSQGALSGYSPASDPRNGQSIQTDNNGTQTVGQHVNNSPRGYTVTGDSWFNSVRGL